MTGQDRKKFVMRNSMAFAGAVATIGLVAAGCASAAKAPVAQQTSSVTAKSSDPATPTPATPASATPAAATGAEAALSAVPWSKVGPGWILAEWSPVTPHRPGETQAPDAPTDENSPTTVYLVDPAGNRFSITTFTPGSNLGLVDWSGDGSHALFAPKFVAPTSAVSVDLHTGEKMTVSVTGYARYSRPSGKALLVSTLAYGDKPGALKRVDLKGDPQFTYPTDDLGGAGQFSGRWAESPDGTQLMLGADKGLVVMGNDGTVIRTLPAPMVKAMCGPVKWWTPGSVLVHCTAPNSSANQLWEVPLEGSTPTMITAENSGQGDDPGFGGDLGDVDAWKLPGGTFLQSSGACGTAFLSKLTPDGHTTRVKIPGMSDDVIVAGTADDRLLVRGQVGCGPTNSLVSYDPTANTATVLLGPPVNGGGVSQAMLYPSKEQ